MLNIDISEINSLLNDYADEAKQSKGATNEIVEEVLHELGYSKRDKKNVHKLFNKSLDWMVRSNGVVTGIHVSPLGTALSTVNTDELFEQAVGMKVNVLVTTDSKLYNIYRYVNKDGKRTYVNVGSIDITNLNERNIRVLDAISFENADTKVIDSILAEGNLTREELVGLLTEYLNDSQSRFIAFVKEHKASCDINDITKSIESLIRNVGTALLTPDEVKLNYEKAEKTYIETIDAKSLEIKALNKNIAELLDKNSELQNKVDVLSNKGYKYALETLKFITEKSGDNSKRFAGYVNEEIYTSAKLHKFVGEMLQRLYAIKSVEAHAYIFDGEYFKLNSINVKNNDMVIKNTVYDIMVNDDEAEDALIRLRAIYSKFPDIVFACIETGFGETKHNTGIDDELLAETDEYGTCADIDLAIITSEPVPKVESNTNIESNNETDSNGTESSEIAENRGTTDSVTDTVDGGDNEQAVEISTLEENKEISDKQSDDKPLDKVKLVEQHIISLECTASNVFKNTEEQTSQTTQTMQNSHLVADTEDIESVPEELNSEQVNQLTSTNNTSNTDGFIAENKEYIESTEDSEDYLIDKNNDIGNNDSDSSDSIYDELDNEESSSDSIENDLINSSSSIQENEINDNIEESDIEESDIDESDIEELDDLFDESPENSQENFLEQFESINENDEYQQNNDEALEEIDDNNQYIEETECSDDSSEVEPILIVTALSAANSLVSDYADDIEFNNIEAITAEEVAFDVNTNYEDLTYDELLVKSLNAVLAIDIYSDLNSKIVTKLKHKRLDELSDFIQLKSAELADFPSIAGTKYVVCGIENLSDLVYTLTRICQAIEVNIDKVYMFMTVTTESDFIRDNFGTTFESIQFRHTEEEYQQGKNENTTISLIRGELFNNLLVTGTSIKAYADIFKMVLGVKTTYMELNINGNNYTSLDAISYMLREAEKQGVDLRSISFGASFGDSHKLISFNEDEVGDNPQEIELYSGEFIYCAELTEWQSVVSIIKVHNALFKNSPIVVKVQVDMDAINFYGSAYDTEIATDSLAICGLAHYVRTHFPQRRA